MEINNSLVPSIEDQEILENFTNFTATRAKCKKCKKTILHTFLRNFTNHLQTLHDYDRIIKLENRIIQEGPLWKYIKLRRDSESDERYECVLCEREIANLNEEFSHHTHAHEEDDYTSRGKNYEEWQIKYCKERISKSIIKCGICDEDVNIKIVQKSLTNHLKNCDDGFLRNERIANKKLLWENYRRFLYWKIQCKHCMFSYQCIRLTVLETHLKINHINIEQSEIDERLKKSCQYLQKLHSDNLLYICTICQQEVSETELLNHKCKEEDNNTVDSNKKILLICSIRMSDFRLKCAFCPADFSILYNLPKVRSHILDKCSTNVILKRKTDTDTVWQHFHDESNTRAICKYCQQSFKYVYIERTAFLNHVKEKHFETFKFEREKQSRSWKYIKYVAGISVCVICDEVVLFDEFDLHMHDDCPNFFHLLQDYEDWLWKYCTTFTNDNDLSVHCDICRNKIQIAYDLSDMRKHLKEIHSDDLEQGIDAIVGIQQQEEGIEGAAGPSFLTDTQQEEDTESASRSSSLIAQEQAKLIAAVASIQEESIEGAASPSFLGGPLFLTGTQQEESIESAARSSSLIVQEQAELIAAVASIQEESIEGAASPSFLGGPLFLTGTQQEESIESATRSSSLATQQQAEVIAVSIQQEEDIEGAADPSFLGGPLFLTDTQQEEDTESAARCSSLIAQEQAEVAAVTSIQQEESIEGAAGPSFLVGPSFLSDPLFLNGTQQEEGIKGAARSSSLAPQQQDVDMSGTSAKQQKID